MKIRRTLALVLAIVTAFSLAACGNAEPAGDDGSEAKTEIVAALNSVPGNLDISATMGVALLSVSPHIYDYLIDMDEDYNFIPAIATSWERVDDTTWTFECDEMCIRDRYKPPPQRGYRGRAGAVFRL